MVNGVVSLRASSTCHKLCSISLLPVSPTLVPPITKLNRMRDADFSAECRKGRRQLCHLKPTLVQKYPGYWMEWSNYLHFIMKRHHQNQINIVVTISIIPCLVVMIDIKTAIAIILQIHIVWGCADCTQLTIRLTGYYREELTENEQKIRGKLFLSYVPRSNTLVLESLANLAATRPFLQLTLFVKQDILSFAFGPSIQPSF